MPAADTVTDRVADAFVLRRVSDGHFAHVGGLGQGERWAGVVSLDDELPHAVVLPDVGGVRTTMSADPLRRFGPYWSAFFVLVRVAQDVVVAFGGPEEVAATDVDWHTSATVLAAQATERAPATELAEELELLHAVRDVALIPPDDLEDAARQVVRRLARALSCEVGGLVLRDGTVCLHVDADADVAPEAARAAVVALVDAAHGHPTCRQDVDANDPGWLRSSLVRPVEDLGTIVMAHTAVAPRGFTALCQELAAAVAAAAATVLRAAGQRGLGPGLAATATPPDPDPAPWVPEELPTNASDNVQPVASAVLRALLHLPPDQVDVGIDHALGVIGRALDLDRAYLFAFHGDRVSNTHEWCAPGVTAEIDRLQDLPIDIVTGWMPQFRVGEPVHVPDVEALPDEQAEVRSLLRAQSVQSLLMVPTMFQGEAVGFVGLDAVRRRHAFDDEAQAVLGLVADIVAAVDARRRASHRVELAEDRTAELLRHSRDHLFLVDGTGHVSWASQSFLELGVAPEQLVGKRASALTHPEDTELVRQLVSMWLRSANGGDLALPDHRTVVGGQTRWVSVVIRDARARPGIDGLIVTAHDVTERRAQTERLRHQALHDDLTGLPNRALLRDRLEVALHRAARNGGRVGVLFLGVDGFKMVNDSRSHAVGDEMLRQIAERLRLIVSNAETAGRFGGDQFVVVIETDLPHEVPVAVDRVTSVFDDPFTIGGQSQSMSASFGLRVSEPGEIDPDAVLRDADNALFAAKGRGRGRLVAFDPTMRERAVRQDDMARRLPDAIARGQVRVHYQPIVDLETGVAVGAEALARWTDPELGEVSPTEFIPVAEQSGLIGVLGTHVLRTACREAAAWPADVYVSVNLSPSQLEEDDPSTTVGLALREAGLPPHRLVLEVTESLLMRDPERSIDHLVRLQAIGVRVALDDFGTGHSSLAILRDLPLDILKIDRSFVVRMERDDRGARMVDGIVSLAEDLGLVTVAEGVETSSQAARLRRAHCGLAQGWLFGHAVAQPVFVPQYPAGSASNS